MNEGWNFEPQCDSLIYLCNPDEINDRRISPQDKEKGIACRIPCWMVRPLIEFLQEHEQYKRPSMSPPGAVNPAFVPTSAANQG